MKCLLTVSLGAWVLRMLAIMFVGEHISDFSLTYKLKCGTSVVCIAFELPLIQVSKILSLKLPLEAPYLFSWLVFYTNADEISIALHAKIFCKSQHEFKQFHWFSYHWSYLYLHIIYSKHSKQLHNKILIGKQ